MSQQPENMTAHMQKVLDILRGLYGWSSRTVIAEKLGRKTLNANDMFALEKLATQGFVEIRKAKGNALKGYIFEYRFIEPEERDSLPPSEAE